MNDVEVPFGDALIAGKSVGIFENMLESIKELIEVKEVIEPDREWAAYYDEAFPYFKEIVRNRKVINPEIFFDRCVS